MTTAGLTVVSTAGLSFKLIGAGNFRSGGRSGAALEAVGCPTVWVGDRVEHGVRLSALLLVRCRMLFIFFVFQTLMSAISETKPYLRIPIHI